MFTSYFRYLAVRLLDHHEYVHIVPSKVPVGRNFSGIMLAPASVAAAPDSFTITPTHKLRASMPLSAKLYRLTSKLS